jgi:hypothetical protein
LATTIALDDGHLGAKVRHRKKANGTACKNSIPSAMRRI